MSDSKEQVLRAVVGGRIERIRLWLPADADADADGSGADGSDGSGADRSGDELAGVDHGVVDVDHGVVVSTTAGELALAWRIDGYREYLSVVGDPAASPAARVERLVDVSGRRPRRGLIGATVTGVGAATAEAEDGSTLLWSVRLETGTGPSLTVALGEVVNGAVEYRPSNLVAVFRRRTAEGYAVEPGGEAAWGSDLADLR